MERTLLLHEGLNHGDVIEVLDTWCDRSYPGSILASSAFTKVGSSHIGVAAQHLWLFTDPICRGIRNTGSVLASSALTLICLWSSYGYVSAIQSKC